MKLDILNNGIMAQQINSDLMEYCGIVNINYSYLVYIETLQVLLSLLGDFIK